MSDTNIDALLQHSGWVRSLAASLARDPGLADDIVQETWISALRRGPKDERSPRGWLATLLRRHLRQVRRGEERRARREETHARELAQASTADVVERAESHRNLVQAVLDLREPFRSTVLLRYLEEHSPDEIAELMGVPVPTVHSRLGRGLAALRERLGRDADSRLGLFGLVLWIRVGRPRAALRAGLAEAPALALLALATTGVFLGAWSLLGAGEVAPDARGPSGEGVIAAGSALAAPEPDVAARTGSVGRVPAETAAEVEVDGAVLGANVPVLLGRVLDREGKPIAGVEVTVESTGGEARTLARCQSASDGSIRFPAPDESALVRARDERWETVFAAVVGPSRRAEVALVVAPIVASAGRVLTAEGTPIAGVTLALWLDPYVPINTALALDFCRSATNATASDAEGRFRFERLPALREARLQVSHPGFCQRHVKFPDTESGELEIVLQRPAEARIVRGVVRDALGLPAAGAIVAAAPARTTADGAGRFELVLAPAPVEERLVAVQPGAAATFVALERDGLGAAIWPEWIELDLAPPRAEVTGRVLDARGRPVQGARVWLADPTLVGRSAQAVLYAESLLADPASPSWRWVASDAEGAFRLDGLLERAYRLCAVDPRDLVLAETAARPGEHVTLELCEDRGPEPVSGRVVDPEGQALAGVRVRLARTLFGAMVEGEPCFEGLALGELRTDAGGRFAFGPCAREGTLLHLESDDILPVAFALSDFVSNSGLELEAAPRAHFRVELAPPFERADGFEMHDADGAQILMAQVRDERTLFYPRAPLVRGRSLVLAVRESARTLVLYRAGEEVARLTVAVRAGGLTLLSW